MSYFSLSGLEIKVLDHFHQKQKGLPTGDPLKHHSMGTFEKHQWEDTIEALKEIGLLTWEGKTKITQAGIECLLRHQDTKMELKVDWKLEWWENLQEN